MVPTTPVNTKPISMVASGWRRKSWKRTTLLFAFSPDGLSMLHLNLGVTQSGNLARHRPSVSRRRQPTPLSIHHPLRRSRPTPERPAEGLLGVESRLRVQYVSRIPPMRRLTRSPGCRQAPRELSLSGGSERAPAHGTDECRRPFRVSGFEPASPAAPGPGRTGFWRCLSDGRTHLCAGCEGGSDGSPRRR